MVNAYSSLDTDRKDFDYLKRKMEYEDALYIAGKALGSDHPGVVSSARLIEFAKSHKREMENQAIEREQHRLELQHQKAQKLQTGRQQVLK